MNQPKNTPQRKRQRRRFVKNRRRTPWAKNRSRAGYLSQAFWLGTSLGQGPLARRVHEIVTPPQGADGWT